MVKEGGEKPEAFKQERRVLTSSVPHHWITQGGGGSPDGAEKGGSWVYNYHEWRTVTLSSGTSQISDSGQTNLVKIIRIIPDFDINHLFSDSQQTGDQGQSLENE